MASESAPHEAASTEYGISADHHIRLHDVRVRALARRSHDSLLPDRARPWAWLIAVASHALLLLLLRTTMREPPPRTDTDILHVDIADLPVAEPALPEPLQKTSLRASGVPAEVALDAPPMMQPRVTEPVDQAQLPDAALPKLFNPDGIAIIPDEIADARQQGPRRGFVQTIEPSPLLQSKRPLKVRPNHFAASWVNNDAEPLDERLWRKLVLEKELKAPWGTSYRCAMAVLAVTTRGLGPALGCSEVPKKAWTPPQTWKPATELEEG
jgi:hypothetical protein